MSLVGAFLAHILHNYVTKHVDGVRRGTFVGSFVDEFVDPRQLLDHKIRLCKENSLFSFLTLQVIVSWQNTLRTML